MIHLTLLEKKPAGNEIVDTETIGTYLADFSAQSASQKSLELEEEARIERHTFDRAFVVRDLIV